MAIWSAEIKELEKLYESFKGKLPELEKELERLIKADDENMILLYSRRCLEVIIIDLCECELKRPRKTEPLKGIIDKLHKEEKVPSNIITSMDHLNSLSAYGAHPKDFDPEQIKPVLINLYIIIKWYLKYKHFETAGKSKSEEEKSGSNNLTISTTEKSIIVLPFENMSSDPEQEYFSDGLTEEIITDLSYIEGLLVISRNSAMTFKGTSKKTKEIANEVNVRYVLEGSVRKAGNNLRITAQLIDASTDTHIWAEKYNGTMDDVFDIQEKVSSSIADSLKIKFSQEVRRQIAEQYIKDPYVYELYLKARYEDWQFNELSFSKGEKLLKQGLEIAGDNVLLYSELSHITIQYVNNLMKDPDTYPELLAKANKYADKAIQLKPNSAIAYYAKGLPLYQSCNPKEAFKNWRKAVTIEPNHSEPMLFLMLGFMYSATGLDQLEAERLLEKCKKMDPLTPIAKTCQGWRLLFTGKFQDAANEFSEWQNVMEQVNSPAEIFFAWFHGLNNDFKQSFRIVDQVVSKHPKHIMASLGKFMKYSWLHEKQKAFNALTEALEKAAWWDDAYSLIIAESFAVLEEYEKAFRWLNRAIDYGITNIPFLSEYDHFLANLKNDGRFEVSMQKANNILSSLKSIENY